jgi:2-polyprenyl-3-methyl-5-hydroxy-6-metoxy-1,4-benzoquinol methylase
VALDIPCGRGRHAELLAEHDMLVIAADLDEPCVRKLARVCTRALTNVAAVRLDANRALPFRSKAFNLVVIVHAPTLTVLTHALPTVCSGGHIIFETFGAQGENWRGLPRPHEVAEIVATDFNSLLYRERPVSGQSNAVTVKGLFCRR